MSRKARIEMLIPGDIVAMYVADRRDGEATIEQLPTTDEFTPAGHLTLWSTYGRIDLPRDSQVDVLAWAPIPESE
jgi:hypothetical protein